VGTLRGAQVILGTQRLTGLPGPMRIQRELASRDGHRAVLYIDIRSFGEFNRLCGADCGDCVLSYLAGLLWEFQRSCGPRASVGHLGGDDFVLVLPRPLADEAIATLRERFCSGVRNAFVGSLDARRRVQELELKFYVA
jgi:c-di-GMP phosphodiesterase